jgi:hypothetical protein
LEDNFEFASTERFANQLIAVFERFIAPNFIVVEETFHRFLKGDTMVF